jgi:hypothetical protein
MRGARGAALLAGATVVGVLVGPARAGAATPGCVTEGEYVAVSHGMPQAEVHRVFGTRGTFLDGGAGGYARAYPRCGGTSALVVIVYAAGPHQRARVSRKRWQSPTVGDVRVLVGGPGADAFDLIQDRGPRRDHLYARGGDDHIVMSRDGYRDVIRCGPGNDSVRLVDGRERHDVYRGCETITVQGSVAGAGIR